MDAIDRGNQGNFFNKLKRFFYFVLIIFCVIVLIFVIWDKRNAERRRFLSAFDKKDILKVCKVEGLIPQSEFDRVQSRRNKIFSVSTH